MQLCRACLSTDSEMILLDDIFVNNYNLLTNLNITLSDEMPQHCCQSCLSSVNNFIEFREKCISSETTLQDIVFTKVKPESTVEDHESTVEDHESIVEDHESIVEDHESIVEDHESIVEDHESTDTSEAKINIIKEEIKEELPDESIFKCCFNDDFADYEDIQYLIKNEHKDLRPKIQYKERKKTTEKILETDSTVANDLKPKRSYKKRKGITKADIKLQIETTRNDDNIISCGLCPKTFDSKDALTEHLDKHSLNKGCEMCTEQVDSLSQMFAHRLLHIPVKQMHCHICSKKYRKSLYLEYHYKSTHFKEENSFLKCKMCSSNFVSPRKLTKHYWAIHSAIRYFCDYCSKGFRNKAPLKGHIKTHFADKLYTCDLCEFSCKYIGGLKDHKVRRHTVNKTYCGICARAFQNQEDKDKHKCGNISLVCPICGVQVKQPTRLSQHMMKHADTKKYTCDRCSAEYKTKAALAVHLNRHDGIRRYKCNYCHAMFFTASVLIKHRRTHTGEKPYVCKVCGKAFTGNNNLKVHMKVHGEYLIVKKNKELKKETDTID